MFKSRDRWHLSLIINVLTLFGLTFARMSFGAQWPVQNLRIETESDAAYFLGKECLNVSDRQDVACLWFRNWTHLTALEKRLGRNPAESYRKLHLARVQTLTTLADAGTSFANATYAEYLHRLSQFSVSTLLALRSWRLRWSYRTFDRDGQMWTTENLDQALLKALVSRTAFDALTEELQSSRITEGLRRFFSVELTIPATRRRARLLASAIHLVQEDHLAAELHAYLAAGPVHHGAAAYLVNTLYSLWADGRPGLITINPAELFFLPESVSARGTLVNVDTPEWRAAWLQLAQASPVPMDNLDLRSLVMDPGPSCQRSRDLPGRGRTGDPIPNFGKILESDCQAQTVSGRSLNIWTSAGLGFERPVGTFSRLDREHLLKALPFTQANDLAHLALTVITVELHRSLTVLKATWTEPLSDAKLTRASVIRSLASMFEEGEFEHETLRAVRAMKPEASKLDLQPIFAVFAESEGK